MRRGLRGLDDPEQEQRSEARAATIRRPLTASSLRKPRAGALRRAAVVTAKTRASAGRAETSETIMIPPRETTGILHGANGWPSPAKMREKSS